MPSDPEPVTQISILEQRRFNDMVYPLVFGPNSQQDASIDTLEAWTSSHRDYLDTLLLQHKAVLFRGFAVNDPTAFHRFIESTAFQPMDYIGGAAVRQQLTSRVFTANESPSSEKIPWHHEMAQIPLPPTHLFFCCETEPTTGGETPILQSNVVYEAVREKYPDFLEKIERLGVRYIRVMSAADDPTSAIGRGWKSTLLVDNKESAEAALRTLGTNWEWLNNGDLKTITAVIPGIRVDEGVHRTHLKTFFNSMVAAFRGWNDSRNIGSKAVVFGDNSVLDASIMEDIYQIMQDVCVAFPWKQGDVLLLDNRTNMHSRSPYTGPRRILAAIARDPSR